MPRTEEFIPLISLNLKGLELSNIEGFNRAAKNRLKSLYDQYGYLRDSGKLTDLQRKNYEDVVDRDFEKTSPSESLKNLSDMLSAHHGNNVVVLIDEYDNPIRTVTGRPSRTRS